MELLVPLITLYVGLLLIRPRRARESRAEGWKAEPRTRQTSGRVLRDNELGFASLRLPTRWRQASGLNEQAVIQASDPVRQRYAVVISESREDFDAAVDLDEYAARTLTQLSDSLRLVGINGPTERRVGGMRALQFEVEGYHQGVRLVYLHTTLEGRRAYHQVLGWATRSTYDRALFDQMLDGFEELPGPDAKISSAPPVIVEAQTQSRYAFH